jgi:outer membrane protein TolC
MKKLNIKSLLFLLLICAADCAANDFRAILQSVERNNVRLQAARRVADAVKLEAKTENTLPAPEVEAGYLWGNKGIGHRVDLGVSQSFEFPSVYLRRAKLIKQRMDNADLSYLNERQQVLLKAKLLCIQIVSYNALNRHFRKDLEQAESVAASVEKQFEKGEATAIEYHKAKQNAIVFVNELNQLKSLKESMLAELVRLNGGTPVTLHDSVLTHTFLPKNFETWLNTQVDSHPLYQMAAGQLKEKENTLKVTKSQCLPNLRVGYASEKERVDHYQGVKIGISLPVWNMGRHIKAHKKQVEAAQLQLKDTKEEIYTHLRSLYQEAVVLQDAVIKYQKTLHDYNNSALLKKSLEHGQINIITYLQEIQWGHEIREKQLETECELELKIAELTASEL